MTALLGDFAYDRHGVRHRHRNFHDGNATGTNGLDRAVSLPNAGRTHHRYDANFRDFLNYFLDAGVACRHGLSLSNQITQRSIRAVREVMVCSTSVKVAIVVSPGVVIAKAPCAAPHS